MQKIRHCLEAVYGAEKGRKAFERLIPLLAHFPVQPRRRPSLFAEDDIVLITYGDIFVEPNQPPLKTLAGFAGRYLKDVFSCIHILPFFPYSSDDGFSVIQFFKVDPELGDWPDIEAIGKDFDLMFDLVVNHFSSKSDWFSNYLAGASGFSDFAITVDPSQDLSRVTRPRALPLLTPFTKRDGETVHVWTTFSADQIDFNYKSLDVLEKVVEVLLFYIRRGARILRLDAIAYLWKEIGTDCIHLPQTHDMVKLFRAILEKTAPDTLLLTETNVPHAENIRYFGDGHNEAHMVYNFTLPPLLLHTFVKEDTRVLAEWAETLRLESDGNVFFNFTASHDGIGVRPLEGILKKAEIEQLAHLAEKLQGKVSYRNNPDGSRSPYEFNVTYVDAILGSSSSRQAEKFLASQAIQYALPGVPATYIHSLLGSRNDLAGVLRTGQPRSINREKLRLSKILDELKNPQSFRSNIFYPYLKMIQVRRCQEAFHPKADFSLLPTDPRVFGIQRIGRSQTITCLTNVSGEKAPCKLLPECDKQNVVDLITERPIPAGNFFLAPYETVWLTGKE